MNQASAELFMEFERSEGGRRLNDSLFWTVEQFVLAGQICGSAVPTVGQSIFYNWTYGRPAYQAYTYTENTA